MGIVKPKLHCPFCGQEETERCPVEGKVLIIFPCMFSPLVPEWLPEERRQEHLDETYGKNPRYFRQQRDRMHLSLTLRNPDA